MLVFQINKTAAILASQTSPERVKLFSWVNTFFWKNKSVYIAAGHVSGKTLYLL